MPAPARQRPGRSACRIGGLGVGLRLAMRQVQFKLDVAQAMAEGQRTRRGAHRVHASFSATF